MACVLPSIRRRARGVTSIGRVGLISPYDLAVPGGVQAQVRAISSGLVRRGCDVVVVSPGERTDDSLAAAGVEHLVGGRTLQIGANGSVAPITLSLLAARRAAGALEDRALDVVHLHEPLTPTLGYSILRRHATPLVGTFHRSGVDLLYRSAGRFLQRMIGNLDEVVAVSDAAAATARQTCAVDPAILFNGFDIDAHQNALPVMNEGPTILFLGRDEPRKGRQVLIEAARYLDPSVTIELTGEPAPVPQGGAQLQFLGTISEDEKLRRLLGADVLCAPSLGGESFGMVLIEGLASSCRIVASDIDGYRQALHGHGLLARPGDPKALAVALSESLAMTDAEDLTKGLAHAQHWSIDALVDEYLSVYERAVESGGRRLPG